MYPFTILTHHRRLLFHGLVHVRACLDLPDRLGARLADATRLDHRGLPGP
jgi:hypothetical protein